MSLDTVVQLNGMKRDVLRCEHWCTARARSSLPVPVSPVISTVMLLDATRRVMRIRSSIASDAQTKPELLFRQRIGPERGPLAFGKLGGVQRPGARDETLQGEESDAGRGIVRRGDDQLVRTCQALRRERSR